MAADALPQPPLRFDVFELDPSNYQLRRRDAEVDLPPQALKILSLLASRPNELVTRKQIKEALWPGESYGDFDSRLNFAIKKLREALGDDAEQPRYVKTVRNAGYMFIALLRQEDEMISQDHCSVVTTTYGGALGKVRRAQSVGTGWLTRERSALTRSTVLSTIAMFALIAAAMEAAVLLQHNAASQAAFFRPTIQPGYTDAQSGPEIFSVSPITSSARQRIVIAGRGLGLHVPYARTDSAYLAIRDQTAKWAAGRLIPQNWDEVMVDVETWTDAEIVVSGFSGDYGKNGWKLTAGDDVEIAIWNPQSGVGPALYHVTVVSLEAAR
jgi:DNA-binding winged helix-turn-helix (wHTH) protein